MTRAGGPWLGGLAVLGAALVLSLLPGGTAGAASGAILALILPGYALLLCLGTPARLDRLSDLLECVAASLAITPLALRLAGEIFPFDRLHVLGVLAGVASGLLVLGALRPRPAVASSRRRTPPAVFAIVIVTLLLLAPTLAIGPTPEGGETRVKGWDLNNHLAIAESIAARGLPPLNPFLASDSPFYYHTFLHILLGAMLVLAGDGAHSYLLISLLTLLLAAVFLVTFHRAVSEITGDERIALLALPLVSLVGGFDLAPMAVKALFEKDGIQSPVTFILRHWNVDGWVSNRGMLVPSFFASFYWVPHAIAALVVFLMALLYLRKPAGGAATLVAAGVCLASMAGYNGYVALGGAATLVLLRGIDALRARDALLRSVLVAGVAIILSLPVLDLYVGQRGDIDKFRWVRPTPLLPLQIVVEFGPALLLGLAGLTLSWRQENRKDGLLPFLLMGVVSLSLLCFVASTGENNDLAMRMSMFVWIGLAVFSGIALNRLFPAFRIAADASRTARIASLAALALGLLSVGWFAAGAAVAKPTLPADEVAAGRWIRTHIASGGLVQGSPLRNNPELVYLSGHPAVLSDTWASGLFYADPHDFDRRMASLREAFSNPDATRACSILQSLRVAALVVGPPEERDFPLLLHPDPWPCLAEGYQRGTYRVYRLLP
ncbi:MAG TPA: hypothetical protein VEW47_06580 [Candidatus Dormibacteraeota bacterium]|nr:hypothetical protein [Candidatus Dormibacteraeota bacterium]